MDGIFWCVLAYTRARNTKRKQGTVVQGDLYVSAMPVDLIKKVRANQIEARYMWM